MGSPVEVQPNHRLIVIVPDCLAGNRDLAHKIFWMANRKQSDVYYLTLVDHEKNLLSANLAMITMKAITANNCLTVQFKLTQTSLWKKTFHEIYQKGDRIICQQEQSVRTGFFTTIPISVYLRDVLEVPTDTISGFYHPEKDQFRPWKHGVIAWSGFLMILFVFLALEILLNGQVSGILQKVVLSFLFSLELGVILAWNAFVG